MNCASVDLKAYILDEGTADERRLVESHVSACPACREELARLGLTHDSLLVIRDEEIPRRIAFVSDKVFEPNWWRRLWNSGPRLGFASAAMLSAALLIHAFGRPVMVAPPALLSAQAEARIEKEVGDRVNTAVGKAVAESEARQAQKTAELVAAAERRFAESRQALLSAVSASNDILYKEVVLSYKASNQLGGGE